MPNWKKVIVSGSDAHLNTLEVTNTTTDDSVLITSTDAGSDAAPVISLKRNSSSPADSDYLGQIKFKGENDADQEVIYSKITGKIQDASDGSEDGIIEFANKKAGSNVITARLKSDKLELLNSTTLEVDGGIDVDNINIDGTTIALSSGDLTLDSAGDIILDADGTDIILKDGGTAFGRFKRDSSDFIIKSEASNNDIIFRGVDSGTTIDALTLDMSEGGDAYFTSDISGSTIRASGDVIAFNSSDKRLKDNIIQIGSPLDKINKIGGYEFDWNENQQVYSGHDVGVIAQEIEEIIPEAVKDRDGGYKGVQYEKIIPLLIEGIKELDKKIKHIEKNCDCLNK